MLTDPATTVTQSEGGRVRPQSLAGGAIGIALLHIEQTLAGHGDQATVHAWLRYAASEPISTGPNANLFHGAPALGFVFHAAAALTGRYRRTLAALDDATVAITRTRLAAAFARIERGDRLPMREFDLIHGLTGLGVYHLTRHPEHPITRNVLDYLVRITRPHGQGERMPSGASVPPWWLPVALTGEPDPGRFPQGHGNLGVAHGMSGVIALLALAAIRGVSVPDGRAALATLCAWTDEWLKTTDGEAWWPGYLTIGAGENSYVTATLRPRPSWCYGVAGTARAQQLAGKALGDTARMTMAETTILAALRSPLQRALVPEVGLCHGKAGLLQAAQRMAADGNNPQLAAEAHGLAADLARQLSAYDGDPELMDGAAGAALALHTPAGRAPATGWDSFLLLA
jgi:hypothetical protein